MLLFISAAVIFAPKKKPAQKKTQTTAKNNQRVTLEQFESLPYVSWSKDKVKDQRSGVVKYDRNKAYFGYNLYTDDAEHAYLMDMEGKIVYSWKFPPIKGKWEHVELLDNKEIVAICVHKCFAKLDGDSNVIWIRRIPAHHDVAICSDGTYIILVALPRKYKGANHMFFEELLRIAENGEIIERWSAFKNLDKLQTLHPPLTVDRIDVKFEQDKVYDYYHTNTIELLPETELGKNDKRFQKGNYLLCLRNANLILILDRDTKDVVWNWGVGLLDWPHMPTMLNNGNILIFDNGRNRSYSRVLELNPVDKQIEWAYKANPPESFHSPLRGSNQRLPNGNTFICESETGRTFEVTRQGQIVWEFLNPEIKDGKRKLIYRMMRIVNLEEYLWLKELN